MICVMTIDTSTRWCQMKKQKFKDIVGKRWYVAAANALNRIGKDNIGLHQDCLERYRKNVVDCMILWLYFESVSGTGYDKNSIVDKKRV